MSTVTPAIALTKQRPSSSFDFFSLFVFTNSGSSSISLFGGLTVRPLRVVCLELIVVTNSGVTPLEKNLSDLESQVLRFERQRFRGIFELVIVFAFSRDF